MVWFIHAFLCDSNHETIQVQQEEKQYHQRSQINLMLMRIQKSSEVSGFTI